MAMTLRKRDEKLVELGDLINEDPRATLIQLRSFAEEATKCLYEIYDLRTPLRGGFLELLTQNSFIDKTEAQLRDQLHFLRIEGNRVIHGDCRASHMTALAALRTAYSLSQYIAICDGKISVPKKELYSNAPILDQRDTVNRIGEKNVNILFNILESSRDLNSIFTKLPVSLILDDKKLYRASELANLELAQELGSITFKSDSQYIHDLRSLHHTEYQSELEELGVVSSLVLSTTLIALYELESVTNELNLPSYQEGESGVIWALKEAREGSIYTEFVAYAVQTVGDESIKILIENGIYDAVKMGIGAAFVSLPKLVFKTLKERSKQDQGKNVRANGPYPYSYEESYEVSNKWKY
ncbi:hypothetical protein VCR12J2_80008 [Vibrio coralliirubri]|uniref:hypothetical protein n=1 Tax=Vibrio TaxID=662 RepID=UPI000636DDDE|nr:MULTISPECIES: hypothetical protein [Vibrio]RLQ19898.1 hypothetical protein AYK60_07460 [Vibrio sp. SBT000027]CDU06674.1 hypothetical protein VCR12J2_80008 [Vibrio coralliirubri]